MKNTLYGHKADDSGCKEVTAASIGISIKRPIQMGLTEVKC